RWPDRALALERPHRLSGHVLELVGDEVGALGELAQPPGVVEAGADPLAGDRGRTLLGRLEERERAAERAARQPQHAAELAAAQDADPHAGRRGSGSASTAAVCSVR